MQQQIKDIKIKKKSIKLTDDIVQFIHDELYANQSSPEQIAGRLKKILNISLHHETIYRYILQDRADGGELYLQLRHKQKPYRKRYGSSNGCTNSAKGIPNRVDILDAGFKFKYPDIHSSLTHLLGDRR